MEWTHCGPAQKMASGPVRRRRLYQRKTKEFNLDNISGLLDMAALKDPALPKKLSLYHTLDYYEKDNNIISDYPVLRPSGHFAFKQGQMYQLMGKP